MPDTSALALATAMPTQPLRFIIPEVEPWAFGGLTITTWDQHNAAMIPIMCECLRAQYWRELEWMNEQHNTGRAYQ